MEEFVRRRNMDGYSREWSPIPSSSATDRRGVVNEAGFLLFSAIAHSPAGEAGSALKEQIPEAFAAAYTYVTGAGDRSDVPEFSVSEKREAVVIAGRLFNFFCPYRDALGMTVSPRFKGSGIISGCVGDVMIGENRLYEVKSGDRAFRSVDYRQLAVYAALRFAETGTPLESIGVLNPRRGTLVEVKTEIFATEISGQSAVSLCQSLIEAFSSNLVSL
jgi:hypothetical protein